MLRFSEFLREAVSFVPNPPKKALLGIEIEPEEEATYRSIVQQNIDNPNTPEVEQSASPDQELSWQNVNQAVSNYVGKQLQQIKAQAGL